MQRAASHSSYSKRIIHYDRRLEASSYCDSMLLARLNCFDVAFAQDKSVPKEWFKAEDVTVFPPEQEILDQGTAIDSVKRFANIK